MCIIAYIPQGKQIKESVIREMFKGNPDGAGIMWKPKEGAAIEIRKGFMNVDDLIKAYNQIPTNCEKAIHCRIATSGKVSVGCCHPFPVRAKINAMKEASDSASIALMHNGIIKYTTPTSGMGCDYSDTMAFAAKVLYPLQNRLDEWCVQTLIENSTTSRLLIFRQYGETLVLGDWVFDNGIYYSNGTYKSGYSRYGFGCYGYGSSYWGKSLKDVGKLGTTNKESTNAITTSDDPKKVEPSENVTADYDDFDDDPLYNGDYGTYGCNDGELPEPIDYVLDIPEDDTESDLNIENNIYVELETAGIDVDEIWTEAYQSKGKTIRQVYVSTFGEINADSVAGYPCRKYNFNA